MLPVNLSALAFLRRDVSKKGVVVRASGSIESADLSKTGVVLTASGSIESDDLSKTVGWLVGCFGFNGPLRQYFSLYQAVSQRKGERGERIDESKNV